MQRKSVQDDSPLLSTTRFAYPANIQESLGKETTVGRSIHPISNWQAFVHLVRLNVGPGILGLPYAVRNGGLLVGSFGLVVVGILSLCCFFFLAHCSRILTKRVGVGALDFGQVAFLATIPFSSFFAKLFQRTVNAFLVVGQFGVCCIFFVFVSDNLLQVLRACGVTFGDLSEENASRLIMVGLLIPLVLGSYIRNLDKLAVISVVANVLIFFGLFVVLGFTLSHLNLPKSKLYGGLIKDLPWAAPPSQWPIFFGTAIYSMGGIGGILPVENKMKKPQQYVPVMIVAMTVVNVIFVSVGVSGYLCFGDNVMGSVTLNLPCSSSSDWLYAIVKLYYAFAVAMTYFLQFYIPVTIIEASMGWTNLGQRDWSRRQCLSSYVFRTTSVVGTCILAIAIPQLGLFISLIGATTGCCLTFVFPSIILALTIGFEPADKTRRCLVYVVCLCFLLIGLLGFGFGTYSSIKGIIEGFSSNSTSSGFLCS